MKHGDISGQVAKTARPELAPLRSVVAALDAADPATVGHSQRVALYSVLIATRMRAQIDSAERLLLAGELHDVGNVAVPRRVLHGQTSFDDADRDLVRVHAVEGARAIAELGYENEARWVHHHHEHWDGSGYPDGLAGEQIPLESRIILGAERLEALTSPRGYRSALDQEIAAATLADDTNRLLDPRVSIVARQLLQDGVAGPRT